MKKNKLFKFIQILIFISIAVCLYYFFNPYLNIKFIQSQQIVLKNFYIHNPILTIFLYIISYISLSLFGLPILTWFVLFSGFLFGKIVGSFIAVFCFAGHCFFGLLLCRYFLREFIMNRYKDKLEKMNAQLKKDGWLYIFFLRVSLVMPSMLVNAVVGLSNFRVIPFTIISVIASLPITIMFVYSGEMLGEIDQIMDLYRPQNLFILLGLLGVVCGVLVFRKYKTR